MTLDKCMVNGGGIVKRDEYGDDKLSADEEVGNANKWALLSNSLSANALRFRIRSVNGDTYIGHRL